MYRVVCSFVLVFVAATGGASLRADDQPPIKVGMIGLDTSHALAFTGLFNRLKERADVSLRIYDVAGRLVRVLVDESLDAGRYVEEWNGRDDNGRAVASGIYFYSIEAGSFEWTRKMVLLR